MRFILNIFIIFCSFGTLAQNFPVVTMADKMPEFRGGTDSLVKFMLGNLRGYLADVVRHSGKAYVNFIVDTTGKVTSPKIAKSCGNKDLDDEAIRFISSMPKWEPGYDTVNKRKVNVSMNIQIKFTQSETAKVNANDVPEGFSWTGQKTNEKKLKPEEQEKHDKAMKRWNEGHKLEEQGKYDKALEKFNESLASELDNKYAMFDKGKLLMYFGQRDKACEIWNKMAQTNNRKDEAEDFVKKYCNENGPAEMKKYYNEQRSNVFYTIAMNELNGGRYENAVVKFDSCLKYNPQHKPALYNKGFMHLKLEQKSAACASWNKLLTIDPNDKQTLESIEKNCK